MSQGSDTRDAFPAGYFPAEYFQVRFRAVDPPPVWPARFVILTAWATTGEIWTAAENRAADARLAQTLQADGAWTVRITGYAPDSGHAEPGWACCLPHAAALALGREFRQHAIFTVDHDHLTVLRCADGRAAAAGSFSARLDATCV